VLDIAVVVRLSSNEHLRLMIECRQLMMTFITSNSKRSSRSSRERYITITQDTAFCQK